MRPKPKYEMDYIESYDAVNSTSTLAGKFLQHSHRILESSVPRSAHFSKVLEVGSGTGHHYHFVKHTFDRYFMTDWSEAMLDVASRKFSGHSRSESIEFARQDAANLSYAENSFDRLIATHVLEHIPDPVQVLSEWCRVIRPEGLLSIVLPCDPGLLWRFGRNLGPRRQMQRLAIDYDYLQAAEHVNSIFNLIAFIRYHFPDRTDQYWPSKIPVPDLNLFYCAHIKVIK